MTDSRESGKPLELSPLAQEVLTGFRITLTEPMENVKTVRFEVEQALLSRKLSSLDYKRIICPYCERTHVDEEHLCYLWLEDHIHMSHGYELPDSHPLSRRTRTQKLMHWLFYE